MEIKINSKKHAFSILILICAVAGFTVLVIITNYNHFKLFQLLILWPISAGALTLIRSGFSVIAKDTMYVKGTYISKDDYLIRDSNIYHKNLPEKPFSKVPFNEETIKKYWA